MHNLIYLNDLMSYYIYYNNPNVYHNFVISGVVSNESTELPVICRCHYNFVINICTTCSDKSIIHTT